MAFIPTANTARSALRMVMFGQDIVNTIWFKKTLGGFSTADLTNLNTDLINWWTTNVAPELCDDISLVEVTSTDQTTSTSPSIVTLTAVPGVKVGDALPGNVCITLKFVTGFRGRSGRGRNYVGGLREADVTGNIVDATVLGNLIAAYDLLRTSPPLAGQVTWSVVSLFTGGAPRLSGLVQTITGVAVADNFVDSQRRRLSGRGS